MALMLPWLDGFSGIGGGVSRVSSTTKAFAFDIESFNRAVTASAASEPTPMLASFETQLITTAASYTQALEASGTAGVRVKAIANASGSLSFLQKSSSDHSTVKLYIVKGWTSNAAIHLQQQALPQLSANAINLLRKEGPLAFAKRHGTHFISGYTTTASYTAMVTLRDSSCSSSREFATKLEADVPIVVDGAAVNVTAGAAFKRYKANIREEQVVDIRVSVIGVDNTHGFHPSTMAELDVELCRFGKQSKGAVYQAVVLPYSVLPEYMSVLDETLSSDSKKVAAILVGSEMNEVVSQLNRVDFLTSLYLSAANAERLRVNSAENSQLCQDLLSIQGRLNQLENEAYLYPLIQEYSDKSSGGYQSGTLHQQLYNALHPIKERMQAMRLLEVARDGTVVVVLYKPLLVLNVLMQGHAWGDYLGLRNNHPTMMNPGARWMIQELPGGSLGDGTKCVTIRTDCDGRYLSHADDGITLRLSAGNTEKWWMEDHGQYERHASAKQVAFKAMGSGYYLSAQLAGFLALRTQRSAWEYWSLHLQSSYV